MGLLHAHRRGLHERLWGARQAAFLHLLQRLQDRCQVLLLQSSHILGEVTLQLLADLSGRWHRNVGNLKSGRVGATHQEPEKRGSIHGRCIA